MFSPDYFHESHVGRREAVDTVHKFGRNSAVGTSFVPISIGGIYRTPQVASATALRVKAGGNAADDAAGLGAREVTIQGILGDGSYASEAVATAGASASSATSNQFIRIFRAFVSASGTYAGASTASHSGDIVIENSAGTEDWATISATDFGRSQTNIGAYSVPTGRRAILHTIILNVDSNKTGDILLFKREGILETSAPYEAMRLQLEFVGVTGEHELILPVPMIFTEKTDFGFMAKVDTGTADVSVDFAFLLEDL